MFDEKTRAASQANLEGFGTAFAGRGESINTAIGAFRPLLTDIVPVMQNLSKPSTGLGTFIQELSDTAAIVAPAAETQASLFRNLDATMAALREVARPYIQDSIEGGKPALDAGIESLPRQRPFLANTEGLMRELRPGIRALRTAAPELASALQTGTARAAPDAAAQPAPGLAAAGGQDLRRRPAGPARHPAHRPTS